MITILKEEHSKVLDMLKELKGLSPEETARRLKEIEKALLAHLEKEDRDFYPVLQRASERDQEIRDTLEVFARDMEKISKDIQLFFERYSRSEALDIEFMIDLGRVITTLEGRIKKEETILFPLYERIAG